MTETGGELLVNALVGHGVDRVFCVPGESYLAVLDALYDVRDSVQVITCRQEGGAAMMAEADGKLTGRPGICFVTRGPGATNASAGVHIAAQDSTPMILFIGQVGRGDTEREAFQEIDYRRMFGSIAKWVGQIDSADRVPEYVARAFAVAQSGRPGPVVLALPEDMLTDTVEMAAPRAPVAAPVETYPSADQMQAIGDALAAAQRPLVIVGGSRWDVGSIKAFERFVAAWDLPVAAAFRQQDRLDNAHPCYVGSFGVGGDPALAERVATADVVLVAGARLDEMSTNGYRLLDAPVPRQQLIHVHAGAEELGKVYVSSLAVNASPNGFASLLHLVEPDAPVPWSAWRAESRADFERWQQPPASTERLDLARVVRWLSGRLPGDAVITNGAGNYTGWVHRFHTHRLPGTQLAPVSGSMGYGLPAAVAAKLRHPERIVVCFAGDGDFLMHGQEIATAAQYGANLVVVVVDNAMYGTIRMHQETHHPGRVIGTDLKSPDFVALAHAFDCYAERVETTEQFEDAFNRAVAAGRPALLHLPVSREALSHTRTLSQVRAAGNAHR
ncbi:thiamine pyrophosphate-binding protein [Amycolatopsis sp. GM8]|uniref:thiamine pyrophosphate-binding protein n=1 Tax=Amycolatopsis sp. GM8 TaxID=2896530 RepID=UPI001F3D682C|nr:thiamine pyrophosphate-binding protein [Amycolatopsis sp. GM8]